MTYQMKTQPFTHQREGWERTRDLPAYAVLWEQGTGKTKLTIDTAGHLYDSGKIDCLIVVAPKGVHRNWISDELPKHMPDSVPWKGIVWQSQKTGNISFRALAKEVMNFSGLAVLAMNYEATLTDDGDKFLSRLLQARKTMLVLDESAYIKNPGTKRTKRLIARGKYAKVRRILTGTPVANSPFDVYSQFAFLNEDIWKPLGCSTYLAFKTYFGVYIQRTDPRTGRTFPDLVRYRNLEQLAKITNSISTRVTKADVLDLPPKLYTKRYFDLGPSQVKAYKELSDLYRTEVAGKEVTTMLAITQLLRLQQIASGFIAVDDGDIKLLDDNPRLGALKDVLDETEGKVIVWAKFTREIDDVIALCNTIGVEAVRYDGQTTDEDRALAIDAFQRGSAKVFVANPAAAGTGLTLHAAKTVAYYSNSFKLTDRLQSEDRAHRIGQHNPVLYIDLIANGTIDEKIVDALRSKLDIASVITGDKIKEWI